MKAAVIYQNNYSRMNKLAGPAADAREINDMFVRCGIDSTVYSSKPTDLAGNDIVFMSGHGSVIEEEGIFLCPQKDYRRKLRDIDYIKGSDVPENAIVLLDACFSAAFRAELDKKLIKGISMRATGFPNKVLGDIHSGLFASTATTMAQDAYIHSHYHGAFSYALMVVVKIGMSENTTLERLFEMMTYVLQTTQIAQTMQLKKPKIGSIAEDKMSEFIVALSKYRR